MWIYPSEMLPLKLRLRGGALAVVSQWLWTFFVVQITPPMITNIGYKSYIVFAVVNFVTIPLIYFFFVSTHENVIPRQTPVASIPLLSSLCSTS
jgi:hypothetical protein